MQLKKANTYKEFLKIRKQAGVEYNKSGMSWYSVACNAYFISFIDYEKKTCVVLEISKQLRETEFKTSDFMNEKDRECYE